MFDSYLILPSSLRTLAIKYNVPVQKGNFPYKFVNETNLDYMGITPELMFYEGLTEQEYLNNFHSLNWNLREETNNYLKSDLISLHLVVTKFFSDIFNNEKLDVTSLATNFSIAFKIFRANYLNNSQLPIIKGTMHEEMRAGYTLSEERRSSRSI